MIAVEIAKGKEAIEALASEWDSLVGDSYTTAFSQTAWHLAWLDAFTARDVTVITARENGRLVGVLPQARIRSDARGMYFSLVTPFAWGDYVPPIVDPQVAAVALPAMLEAAFRHYRGRGVYFWPNVPAADPSLDILRSFFAGRGMPVAEQRETAARLRIDGASFQEIEKRWRSSHRIDVRRQRKRLAEQGPVTLWQPSTIAEAEPVLEEFYKVHDEKWLKQGFPGMFQDPAKRLHFHSVLRRMWGRGMHFSTVRCGSTDVSYHFGFFAGGWLQWYRPSYRAEFSGFSPSKIHIALLIEEACRSQWKGLDFLLGPEPYKDLWSNESIEVVSLFAGSHRWSPSYFWFTKGKPYTKAKLARAYMDMKMWLQKHRKPLS